MADESKGIKFPLLVYRRWARMLRLPSLLIVLVCGVAWWYAAEIPLLADYDWAPLAIGGVGLLIFFYSLLARQAAYVQCLPNYVKIRTPFMSVVISYRRVLRIKPTEFHSQLPLGDLNSSQRRLLNPFLGRTVILLELNSFPVSERRLRTWMPWFMFATEATGLVLVVDDWMALSQQLTVFTDRWVARRQERQRSQSSFFR